MGLMVTGLMMAAMPVKATNDHLLHSFWSPLSKDVTQGLFIALSGVATILSLGKIISNDVPKISCKHPDTCKSTKHGAALLSLLGNSLLGALGIAGLAYLYKTA